MTVSLRLIKIQTNNTLTNFHNDSKPQANIQHVKLWQASKKRFGNPQKIYLSFCFQFLYCGEGLFLFGEISLHIMFLPTIVRQTFIFIIRIPSTMLFFFWKFMWCTFKTSINRSTVEKPKLFLKSWFCSITEEWNIHVPYKNKTEKRARRKNSKIYFECTQSNHTWRFCSLGFAK